MEPNAVAKIILEEARRRGWGETHHPYGPENDPEAEPGSVRLEVPVPGQKSHRIDILQRGNTVEVGYTDGLPPGPAESQFVFRPGEETDCIGAAFDYVDSILRGDVLVVREPLPWWVRLLVRAKTALRVHER